MQEVIYNYYTDHYGGRVIPENEFSYVIKKAEMYLHSFTFNQLEGQPYDNIVKNCLCDMAEAIYKVEKQGDESIKKSESTDGYSVSYVVEYSKTIHLKRTGRRTPPQVYMLRCLQIRPEKYCRGSSQTAQTHTKKVIG